VTCDGRTIQYTYDALSRLTEKGGRAMSKKQITHSESFRRDAVSWEKTSGLPEKD